MVFRVLTLSKLYFKRFLSAIPGGIASGGSIKSGMVERDVNKSESPDAIKKNKLNVESYLVSYIILWFFLVKTK